MKQFRAMYFYSFLLALFLVSSLRLYAQNTSWTTASTKNAADKKTHKSKATFKDYKEQLQSWGMDSSYRHTFLIGGRLTSDGWSGNMYFMKKINYGTTNYWQIGFSEIKHEKQVKQDGNGGTYPKLGTDQPYIYGKINNLYAFQIGFGKESILLPAVMQGSISISFRYAVGTSLALLKPYYLKLIYLDSTGNPETARMEQHKYSQADSSDFLNVNSILGSSTWTKGLNETNYIPGAFIDISIAMMPGKNKAFVQMITLGISGSYYGKPLAIMADQKAYPWQVSIFAGLALGKKWQ